MPGDFPRHPAGAEAKSGMHRHPGHERVDIAQLVIHSPVSHRQGLTQRATHRQHQPQGGAWKAFVLVGKGHVDGRCLDDHAGVGDTKIIGVFHHNLLE
ncbi:gsl0916 [Gloeobacter violaceus PCC 7421]|uniref:Gsl0916 protein n=1 Tax=Gloeobacter violaceus (strain ATCC 29082 / PCC 7421) TaxID=251221 RepID=Q7NM53_GLOVI|nr:gsl0916 [Gloeobacter violaceus PCC 7421]